MSGLFLKRLLLWRNGDVTYRQTVSSDLLALSRMCQALISSGLVLAFMSSDPKNKFYDHVATPDAHGTLVWVESLEKARYPTMVNPPARPSYTCTVNDHWTWYPTPSHFHWPIAILVCLAVLQGLHSLIYFFRGRAYSVFANQPDAQFVGSPPTRFKLAAHFIRGSGWVVKVLNVALAILLFLAVYHLVIGSCHLRAVRSDIQRIHNCRSWVKHCAKDNTRLAPACNLYYNYRAFPSVPCGTGRGKSKPCRTMGFKWSASESAWIAREFKSPTICNDAAWKGQGKEAGLDTLAPFWPRTPMSLDLALSSQGALALKHEDAGRWISFLDSVAEDVGAVEVSPEQSSENAEEPDLPWTGWKTVDLAFAASYRLGMRSLIEDSFLSRVSSLWAFTMLMVFVLERYVISRLIQSGIWDLYPQTPSLPPYGNRMVVKALRYKGFGASTEGSSTGLVKRWPTETSFVKTSSSFAVDGLHSVSHTHQAAVVQPLGSFLPLEGAIRIGSPGHEEYQGMGLLGQPPVSPTANHFGTTRLWHWADSASQERTSETWDRPEVPHQVPVLGGDLLIFGSPMDSKTSQTILRQLEALSARWITA